MGQSRAEENSVLAEGGGRWLTRAEFHRLSDVPPEAEWFANLDNPNTRRAYKNDVEDFLRLAGVKRPEDFRIVTRAHVLRWRKDLEMRAPSAATIRRKLSALSDLPVIPAAPVPAPSVSLGAGPACLQERGDAWFLDLKAASTVF